MKILLGKIVKLTKNDLGTPLYKIRSKEEHKKIRVMLNKQLAKQMLESRGIHVFWANNYCKPNQQKNQREQEGMRMSVLTNINMFRNRPLSEGNVVQSLLLSYYSETCLLHKRYV